MKALQGRKKPRKENHGSACRGPTDGIWRGIEPPIWGNIWAIVFSEERKE